MENKLTDEEVWLRAYCAAISAGVFTFDQCLNGADTVLYFFNSKFRSSEDNERAE